MKAPMEEVVVDTMNLGTACCQRRDCLLWNAGNVDVVDFGFTCDAWPAQID